MRSHPHLVPVWMMAAVFAAAGVSLLLSVAALASGDVASMRAMNGTLPVPVGVVCLAAGYVLVRRQPAALWTPIPWFLAAWSAYYAFGPLVYVYGTPESVAYMDNLYPVDATALLRTNALNFVGLLAVIGGAVLVSRLRLRRAEDRGGRLAHDPWRVALLFLAIGLPIKYLLELPYVLGLFDFILPGTVQYFGTFSGLAILPLSVAAGARRKWAKPVLWTLIVAEIAVGVVMLAKLQIIKTVLLAFLGRYAVKQDLRRLLLLGVIVLVAYVAVLSPFVNFARVMLGRSSAEDINQAVVAAQSFATEGRETIAEILPGVQSWWTRLAYPNAQAYAMAAYDQGRPGWTFGMTTYVVLPRFLYDDKPIMTPGIEYTRLIQGTDTSSTGLGFVGEAYWNGGWPFVVATGLFVGGLFAVLGRMSVRTIVRRQWLYVPLVFQAIYLGLRPDDWFVPAYVGGVLQVLIVVALLALVAKPLVGLPSSPSRAMVYTPSVARGISIAQ